jgi:hypothetical protein
MLLCNMLSCYWRFVMGKQPWALYSGYKLTLYGLVSGSFDICFKCCYVACRLFASHCTGSPCEACSVVASKAIPAVQQF